MNISIIIPNFNGRKLLEKNLPKVIEAAQNYKNGKVEIIVVDDASRDDSVKFLNTEFKKKIILVENDNNLGFSSTVNAGVKKTTGEIMVLLNTDIHPEKDFLKPLMEHFVDQEVFAVGCMDKSTEGERVILRGRGIGKWQRGFLVHQRGETDKNNTLWVSGGSGAFRKSIWEKLGGLNTIYNPFYWEDIDLSYRALKSGYKIIFESKSIVWHNHEEGSIKSAYSPQEIKTIAYRNQYIFTWVNGDLSSKILNLCFLPYYIIRSLLRGDIAFLSAVFKAFTLLPKIVKSSAKAKKLFIKTDKDVVKELAQ